MPFQKGQKKTGGRKAGTPNRQTAEVRAVARKLLQDATYRRNLLARLREGRAGRIEPLLWHYAWGVPKQEVALTEVPDLRVTFGGRYRPEGEDEA